METANESTQRHQLTQLIRAWQEGDLGARSAFVEAVYDRVKAIAAQSIQRQNGATLSATELAHESLLRLLDANAAWADRRHFFHVIAQATRQVLIDHARRRLAGKRGAGIAVDDIEDHDVETPANDIVQLMRVNDALTALSQTDERRAKIIEMTYFGGFSREEIAAAMDVSVGTIDRDLRFARAWLKEELEA